MSQAENEHMTLDYSSKAAPSQAGLRLIIATVVIVCLAHLLISTFEISISFQAPRKVVEAALSDDEILVGLISLGALRCN